ncbi:AmmeMemoRadiSam system protein B [bacterium]|nr:AmmeMemoRadiSam system protein B [bacterium]
MRHVEPVPVEVEGRSMISLKDPQRYASAMITLDRTGLFLVSHFDGRTPLGALAHDFEEQARHPLPAEDVERLISVLDRHFYLDNARFQMRREQVDKKWYESPIRPSALFDYATPGREKEAWDELRNILDTHFRDAGYPVGADIRTERNDLAALIAPHIDFIRGGAVWAHAYAEFARSFRGRTAVIVGTNHQPHKQPVSMTRKHFATPFALMRTDIDLAEEIAAQLPLDPFEDELPHRAEHSIELPAVMLAYLRPDIRIVPILVGGARHLVEGTEDEETEESLAALASACAGVLEGNDDAAIIASADLAHVGPMFNDPFRVDDTKAAINRERDLDMLDPLTRGEPEGFVRYVVEEKDVRKVCGLTPIYVVASACGTPFTLLAHDQWVDKDGQGLVSYAALASRRAR